MTVPYDYFCVTCDEVTRGSDPCRCGRSTDPIERSRTERRPLLAVTCDRRAPRQPRPGRLRRLLNQLLGRAA